MSFPSLSQKPLEIEVVSLDNSLRNQTDAGYEVRRVLYTRKKKAFTLKYQILDDNDKNLLSTFESNYGTSKNFPWLNHQENKIYNVYLDEPLKYRRFCPGWWSFDPIKLVEV